MKKSSPRPDGISYAHLGRADSSCHVLAAIFNACLKLGKVPRCWNRSNTVLLYKKCDRGLIESWPTSMGDTTAKLFAALLADRLTDWAIENGRLSPTQKGFLRYEGCYKQKYVLQEAIWDARRSDHQIVVAWLDLSNAFGSVPHKSIREALRGYKVPTVICEVSASAYDVFITRVETTGDVSEPIPILSGVRQGYPLSPIIFNLTLEPVARAIKATGGGYKLES
jgi:hypothetical protein